MAPVVAPVAGNAIQVVARARHRGDGADQAVSVNGGPDTA
jgi:hypothetical protein